MSDCRLVPSRPLFSIVIPCYNRADSVLPTLQSVQRQTWRDFECVVVDDGSDDGEALARVVNSLEDLRFRVVRQNNGGGGAARNTGIQAADGEYIAFLDSDDLFVEDKLEVFSRVVRAGVNNVWYSQAFVDRGVARMWLRPSRPLGEGEDVGEYLFVHNEVIQTSTIVMPRVLALAVPFDPDLRKGQDLDLCVRLASRGVKFVMVDRALTVWVDRTEAGRTSRHAGYVAPLQWLARSEALLSERARLGYRANVLSYYVASDKPLVALLDILRGWRIAKVPATVSLRQMLRCFLPRSVYRALVNRFVAIRGAQ